MISKTFSVILIEVARAPDTAERAGVKPPSKGIVVCDGSFESTVVGDSSSSAIGCGPVASAFPRRQRCDVLSMVNPHAQHVWADGGADRTKKAILSLAAKSGLQLHGNIWGPTPSVVRLRICIGSRALSCIREQAMG